MSRVFRYEAVGADGQIVRGHQDADDLQDLIDRLGREGLSLLAAPRGTSLLAPRRPGSARLKATELAQLAGYVAITSRAGLSIVDSIEDFAQDRAPPIKELLGQVVADVRAGQTLSDAFAANPRAFNGTFLSMVRAGEESGSLDEALDGAARQIGFQCEVRSKLKQALIQPALLLVCVSGLVTLLITYLLPKIMTMLASSNVELPASTAALLAISHFLTDNWIALLVGLVLGGIAVRLALRTERGRRAFDRLLLMLPVLGPIVRMSAEARFVSTMSTLMRSGVDAVRSLRLAASTTGSRCLGARLEAAADRVSEGSTLAEAMRTETRMHPLVRRMISLGETAGSLEQTLGVAVDFFAQELPRRVSRAMAVVEPLIIVFSGIVVAFILLSALLPVFSLYESI